MFKPCVDNQCLNLGVDNQYLNLGDDNQCLNLGDDNQSALNDFVFLSFLKKMQFCLHKLESKMKVFIVGYTRN